MEEAQNNALIGVDEFNRVEMRAGTIIEAGPNKKARNPAYKLKIDFGPEIGVKSSSAQITELYTAEQLINNRIVRTDDQILSQTTQYTKS